MYLKLIYTPIHLNTCGLVLILEYPNKAEVGARGGGHRTPGKWGHGDPTLVASYNILALGAGRGVGMCGLGGAWACGA